MFTPSLYMALNVKFIMDVGGLSRWDRVTTTLGKASFILTNGRHPQP